MEPLLDKMARHLNPTRLAIAGVCAIFLRAPDVKSIAVLPPGTRLRITRLLEGQGQNGGYGVEGVVEDGTTASKTVYVDRRFLFENPRWVSNTNWGVNPDMLEKP